MFHNKSYFLGGFQHLTIENRDVKQAFFRDDFRRSAISKTLSPSSAKSLYDPFKQMSVTGRM